MMMKLPIDLKKEDTKTLVFIILAAAIFLVVDYMLILKPQLARLTSTLQKVSLTGSEYRKAEADITNIEKFSATIQAYRDKVDRYEKRLPAEKEIPALLQNLSEMAKSSNIKILAITPMPASLKEAANRKDKIYREMPIVISAKSGYHELGQFLINLENADRFMKVVDLDIKSNKSSPKKHDVELVVLTFILLKEK